MRLTISPWSAIHECVYETNRQIVNGYVWGKITGNQNTKLYLDMYLQCAQVKTQGMKPENAEMEAKDKNNLP